ncbi:hypothetical protein JCM33374_g3905 [Metschnikowia sp. JCM 33374]|nr:hypothetical protein JCM33374_g3905 [Metschnikowia sp. JCM 33374]
MAISTYLAINSLYMMYSTFLLVFIVIGISMFYSGLTQRRSSFTMLGMPLLICGILFVDWFIWGYSLCYSTSSNKFIGNLDFVVLKHLKLPSETVYSTPRGDILAIIHFLFNGFMKLICAALTFPACGAERARIAPMLLFVVIWSVIIYNPVSYWIWDRNGWLSPQLNRLPVLDFAGGNCIHIVSGFTALAYSYYIGPRNPEILRNYRGSNNSIALLGLTFILFGWTGFISGCDFNFTVTSIYLIVATFLCAFSAGIVWTAIDYYYSAIPLDLGEIQKDFELSELGSSEVGNVIETPTPRVIPGQKRTLSIVSFSSGVMCGLVVFTPGGGYLCYTGNFWKSIVCGVVGGIVGNLSTRLKYFFGIDDALDIFAVHGICGIAGSLLVGIFSEASYDSHGGWIEHNWIQFAYQLLGSVVTSAYVFFMSLVVLYLIDLIPGMHLRIDKHFNRRVRAAIRGSNGTEDAENSRNNEMESQALERAEIMGSDYYELNGEYSMDFVEFIKIIDPDDFSQDSNTDETTDHWPSGSNTDKRLRKRLHTELGGDRITD